MKNWLRKLFYGTQHTPETPQEATETALRVFPRCC